MVLSDNEWLLLDNEWLCYWNFSLWFLAASILFIALIPFIQDYPSQIMYAFLAASKWKDSNHISTGSEKFRPSYFILLLEKVWCCVYTRVLLKKASEFGVAQEMYTSSIVA